MKKLRRLAARAFEIMVLLLVLTVLFSSVYLMGIENQYICKRDYRDPPESFEELLIQSLADNLLTVIEVATRFG